jgi:hypothetical protein
MVHRRDASHASASPRGSHGNWPSALRNLCLRMEVLSGIVAVRNMEDFKRLKRIINLGQAFI